ncbi:MAG TPA: hypothetical protein VGR66_04005 [Candidatus Eisenbacteria bacterium]|jgi:hypothetical protein|nr:hypothetical protein [Candidatus Eisenbacteria bacterium]
MRSPRLLAVVLALVVFLALVVTLSQSFASVPSSIGLVYTQKKNFKVGDWVLYRITGTNQEGQTSVDYQRVQVVLETRWMGEPCVWIETGFGPAPDSLDWSAALFSENAYLDTIAYLRPNFYLRRLHVATDPDGTPRAVDVHTFNPKIPLKDSDFDSRRPVMKDSHPDTLAIAKKGSFPCEYYELVRTHTTIKNNPDVNYERGTESTVKRWLNPDLVPITGILREEEHKLYKEHAWPVGKVSTDYPVKVVAFDDLKTELVDWGTGAKPRIANRIKDARDQSAQQLEP